MYVATYSLMRPRLSFLRSITSQLLAVDPVPVVDVPLESDRVTHFAAELVDLLDGVLATLPEPETRQVLPLKLLAAGLQHLLREVDAP